jgi:hypothetical protein
MHCALHYSNVIVLSSDRTRRDRVRREEAAEEERRREAEEKARNRPRTTTLPCTIRNTHHINITSLSLIRSVCGVEVVTAPLSPGKHRNPHRCEHYTRLRYILRTQRVQYRTKISTAFEKLNRKRNKIIEPEDAKRFISSNQVDATLFSHNEKRVFAPFFLLTGGALEAIDALAQEIVYKEEHPDVKPPVSFVKPARPLRSMQSMPVDKGEKRELKIAITMNRQSSM